MEAGSATGERGRINWRIWAVVPVLLLAIAFAGWDLPLRELLDFLMVATLVTTVLSGADYLRLFVQRAWWLPASR